MPAISSNLPLLDERDHAWDSGGAKGRVAKWASSDGSGDKDKVDWGKYQKAFFMKDDGDAEDFGDYHLPFADVFDGELKAVWKGVAAAANAANGGRGASGYGDAKPAIEKYYKRFATLFKDDTISVPWGEDRKLELAEFQRAFGEFGGVERRYAHVGGLQTRDNGDPDSLFSVTGSAIVFNRYSLDLGGFKEEIAPEAVRAAMEADDADYHLLWDHDTTLVLARNRNGTLNAEIGPESVDFWGRVAKTSYAADLRVLMDRGDVDECSFAFTIAEGGEEWRMEDDGSIVRRVTAIEKLWDLTICARGAYPQTQSATVRSAVAAIAQERASDAAFTEALATVGQKTREERALTPGLVAWDDEQGYWDVGCDIECELAMRETERYVYWWLIDLNVRDGASEAIVCKYDCNDGTGCYYLVSGITYDAMKEPVLPDNDSFQPVDQKWVAVPEPAPEQDDDTDAGDDADDDEGDDYAMRKPTNGSWEARIVSRVDEADSLAETALRAEAAAAANPELAAELLEQADEIAERHVSEDETEETETEETEETETEETEVEETEETEVEETETEETEVEETEETEVEETDEDAEERKRKAALARARGRAALA